MQFLKNLFGNDQKKTLKRLQPLVDKINILEEKIKSLTDAELRKKTDEFKTRIGAIKTSLDGAVSTSMGGSRETLDDILPEAFAVVREASRRTLGQRHHDVQLIGGAIIHQGGIAEMRTGEGKTLVATLPAYLNALTGRGVHVITVNDYLSRRDAVWMGQIYAFLGLSVGVINHDSSFLYDPLHKGSDQSDQSQSVPGAAGAIGAPASTEGDPVDHRRDETGSYKVAYEFLRPCERTEAYKADITYGTNNQFGFDYLFDNIEYETKNIRQIRHNFAIIDEVDSILIDEARTPLIISAPTNDSEDLYEIFAKISSKLNKEEDYTIDEKYRSIQLTDKGIEKAEKALGVDNIYTEKGIKYVHHLETAVRAKALYSKDKEYVVRGDEVVIVDEFTGRLQPGRRWSDGLHQAIEAKEGVLVQKESRTYASITFQNYFRLYEKLAGMTGTALTSKEEFYKVYGLDVLEIPTNKPIARKDHNDLIFQTEKGKFTAITRKVKELHAKGQPVLIGTVSIEKNELLSEFLKRQGIPHQMLNAKPQHAEREGEIVAEAGKKGQVTIATNMAGRGVDIKLGGAKASPAEYEEIKALGGLFVLGTERHEARRIDNQLRGRSGRQGDPGETEFFVSLEDSLMRIFASDTIGKLMGKMGIAEDEPVENAMLNRSLESAQTKIEGFHFDSRKHVLEYDDVLNLQRKTIYANRRAVLFGDRTVMDSYIDMSATNTAVDASLASKIADKKKEIGEEAFYQALRRMILQTIDLFWVDHLEMMDYMRNSVRLRAYGQRDPLVEYKREGLALYKRMESSIKDHIKNILPNTLLSLGAGSFMADQKDMERIQKQMELAGSSQAGGSGAASGSGIGSAGTGGANGKFSNVGRNDPCPCGSGKKFKKCHGK